MTHSKRGKKRGEIGSTFTAREGDLKMGSRVSAGGVSIRGGYCNRPRLLGPPVNGLRQRLVVGGKVLVADLSLPPRLDPKAEVLLVGSLNVRIVYLDIMKPFAESTLLGLNCGTKLKYEETVANIWPKFGTNRKGLIKHASGKKLQEVLEEAIVHPLHIEGELYIGIPPGLHKREALGGTQWTGAELLPINRVL
ncbi:hypothetical protein E2562_013199 [Oryza meyeriana var. granulata]|uniref:Uncharacterized protein n=1 Tax=Oryza meyeriana var. granulata TaxID=110450 RepID=A0A6G1DIF3_9ORYZ|nr:hypothetical protein E2562_013199 [Oryza meyeriana var. granulata]